MQLIIFRNSEEAKGKTSKDDSKEDEEKAESGNLKVLVLDSEREEDEYWAKIFNQEHDKEDSKFKNEEVANIPMFMKPMSIGVVKVSFE